MFNWLSRKSKTEPVKEVGSETTKPPILPQKSPILADTKPPIISNAKPPILPTPIQSAQIVLDSPKVDAPPIILYDRDGHAYQTDRGTFATKVLAKEFQDAANHPEQLFGAITIALQRGFFKESLPPAERLFEIDPDRDRAAIMLGIAFMKNGKLDEAERILSGQLARAKSGPLMVNLAKVWEFLGRETEAHKLLREALAVDPNMDNGLEWYAAIARDEGGQEGYLRALRDVAREPNSWRPQLWLARDFLEHGDGPGAVLIYKELMRGRNLPGDGLMMITGDLGKHGCLSEMIEIGLPVYNENIHGIEAGINLLQACMELGLRTEGLDLCNRLDKLERYDYKALIEQHRATLGFAPSGPSNGDSAKTAITSPQDSTPEIEAKEVEKAIAAFHAGDEQALGEFYKALHKSTVGVLVRGPRLLESALHLVNPAGVKHLAIFTQNEHGKLTMQRNPKHHYMLWIKMRDLCRAVGGNPGLIVNPEHTNLSLVLGPERFGEFSRICTGA